MLALAHQLHQKLVHMSAEVRIELAVESVCVHSDLAWCCWCPRKIAGYTVVVKSKLSKKWLNTMYIHLIHDDFIRKKNPVTQKPLLYNFVESSAVWAVVLRWLTIFQGSPQDISFWGGFWVNYFCKAPWAGFLPGFGAVYASLLLLLSLIAGFSGMVASHLPRFQASISQRWRSTDFWPFVFP